MSELLDTEKMMAELKQISEFEESFYSDPQNAEYHLFSEQYKSALTSWKLNKEQP